MRKDIEIITAYCNKCGKAWESDSMTERCIYCGSEAIIKVKCGED